MEESAPKVRKSRKRRPVSAFGYSLNDSTVAYGSVGDEVDDGIDPEQINEIVRRKAVIPDDGTRIQGVEDETEREVREQYKTQPQQWGSERAGSSAYERELRLRLVHRLLLRDVPLQKIADKLGVSLKQVYSYRKEIADRLKQAAANLDVNEMVGDSMGFYKEIQAMSLRTASDNNIPINLQLAALRTSLAAKNDMHRFLQAAGVFDVLRFKPKDNVANQDIQKLVAITESLLFGDEAEVQEVEDTDEEHIQLL
jgi:transposase-like protein